MMRALWTAGTGMAAQQTNVDVISNNLANVNTTGYKKSRPDFADLMYQTLRQPGATSGPDNQVPTGVQIGHGVRLVATQKMYTEGSLQQTGNPYDIAIEGDGFFQISMPDGTTGYTRDGGFKLDSQGRVVTSDGYLLQPQITVPSGATNFAVSADGIVTVSIPSQTTPQNLGQIQLAMFVNPAGLTSLGRNMLQESDSSGTATVSNPGIDGAGSLQNQYLEMSNVQVVDEMVSMIVAQRAYEINSKAVQTCDDMLSTTASMKR
ncbi:MAG: flagellar basal-body rod protein FlgG [Negativicutes bacterium]|nr:flagellar basal-body rod protein FlgG [Negativicutes bacterium]MDR3592632.1 flagellar basal-body rod protein FlgG [Negativicutes bacterium]